LAVEAKNNNHFVSESAIADGTVSRTRLAPGSFFLVSKTADDWVHVGIVSSADAESFDTLEGNTDHGGSSNGFEAAARTRGYEDKDFIVW